MSAFDGLRVASGFGSEVLRMAGEAIGSGRLPLRTSEYESPAAIGSLLERHGAGPWRSAPSAVRRLDIDSPSSNCTNAVLSFEYADGDAAGPKRAYLKLPSDQLLTRAFCAALRIWEIECAYYRNAAPLAGVRVPECHAVANDGTRFVLLLEDLYADESVELFTNARMVEGITLDDAARCLATLAELHASFAGRSAAEREKIVPTSLHPFLSPRSRRFTLALNRISVGACAKKAPDLMTADVQSLMRRAFSNWDALIDAWFSEPLTLIHGDSHIGNFFRDGERMGMLDFQGAQWAPGMRDVQYCLINSVPADLLAANERNLLRHYASELGAHGVTLSEDAAFAQYRALSFQTLMTAVVSLGLGTMTESENVMRTILARSLAATQRLEWTAWLESVV